METKIGEFITILLGAMSAVLAVGIALAWVEGQWGAMAGRPGQLYGAASKIIYLAVCGMIVTGAAALSSTLWGLLVSGQGSASGLSHGMVNVALVVVDTILVAISILLTIGILSGAIAGQFFITLGSARGWSDARSRMAGAIIFGIGGLLTIPIANIIVSAVAGG